MKTVYLAGPIVGCDVHEANDWRDYVIKELIPWRIRGISPLRCEPLIGERYAMGYADPKFGTARAIASKNFFDVQNCDMTLCYMPKPEPGREHSKGTICELAWAFALRKPTILVTDDENHAAHPVISANAGWLLPTLDDAIEVITGILDHYGARLK